MIRRFPAVFAIGLAFTFLTILFQPVSQTRAQAESPTLADYRQALEEIRSDFLSEEPPKPETLREIADRLLAIHAVQMPDGQLLPVDHTYLAGLLTPDPPRTDRFLANLEAIQARLESPPAREFSSLNLTKLDQILARPEFQWEDAPPNPFQDLLQRGYAWLIRTMNQLFPNVEDFSGLFNAALASLLTAIIAAILFYVYRATMRGVLQDADAARANEIPEFLTADQSMARAQELSRSGDLRSAVRYLYLATLLGLEERGLIRLDRTQTNHEVLSSLSGRPELVREFESIIDVFDRVWYGFQPIDLQAFETYSEKVRHMQTAREAGK